MREGEDEGGGRCGRGKMREGEDEGEREEEKGEGGK